MKFFVASFFLFTLLGGIGIVCVVWTVITVARGEYLTVIVLLTFAAFCFGMIAPLIIIKSGRVTARGEFEAAGTMIRPDRAVDLLFQASALASFIAMGLFAIFAPLGKLDIPVPPGMRHYLVFASAAGAVLGVPSLWRTFARGGVSYLRLNTNAVEFAQGLSSVHISWDEVQDVADRPPRGPQPARGTIFIVTSDGRTRPLAADSYTPGGHALRQLVRFYWQHPEHRTELTDGRALERLRDEEFKVER